MAAAGNDAADIKAAMTAADSGQCIYYLEARIRDSTKDPSGLAKALKDFRDGVASKFTPKYGASEHADAKAARAKYEALIKAADEKMVLVLELQDITKMEDAIKGGSDNRLYYLENRTKNANDSKEIRRYLDPVKRDFAPFAAKYGTSKRAEAQKIMTDVQALIKKAEDTLPDVLETEDIKVMGDKITKDGQNLYYLNHRTNNGPVADIKKYLALVKPPFDAFMAKYGKSTKEIAQKYIKEAEPVIKKAEEEIPKFAEKEDIIAMVKAIDVQQNPYYLEARVKAASDAKEIKKYLDLVATPYRAFAAKYANSPLKEAKDAVAKYEPLIKKAEELIPFVAEGQEVAALAAKCDEGQAVWYLEKQLKEAGQADLLKKRLDAVATPFAAFKAKFGGSTREDVKKVLAKYEPLIAAAQGKLGGASETDAIAAAIKAIDPENAHYYVSARVRDNNNPDLMLRYLNPLKVTFGAFKTKWGTNSAPEVKAAIEKYQPLIDKADAMLPGMQEAEALEKDVRELNKDQILYYINAAVKNGEDAELIQKRIDAMEAVLTPFQTKWGACNYELFKKTNAEYSAALKAAKDILPSVLANVDVKRMLKEIDNGHENNTYYLEAAIKSADDLDRLQKYITAVQLPYQRFKAKYGGSDIKQAQEAIARYDALLKKAEELVPVVAASADCNRLIKAIDGDSGDQNLYYLQKAVESASDAERLRKYIEAVEPPFEAFCAKYGASDNPKAVETKAKVGKLLKDAAEVLPAVIERSEIAAAEKAIDTAEGGGSSPLWHLQKAIERADSVDDLKKWGDAIRAPFERFVAKWGSSPREEAKKVIAKFSGPLKQAEELIPVVLVNDDMFKHIRACEGDPGTGASSNVWYLERAVKAADNSEMLQKYLALVQPKYDAFVAKYGGNDHKKAKECVEKVGGLVKQANEVLPRILELEALQKAELAIDKENQLWYLQKAIERADNVDDLKKGILAIKPGFDAFAAKYRASALPQAPKVIAKYEPVLKQAEELIPVVLKDQDMFNLIRAVDGDEKGGSTAPWYLEQSVRAANDPDALQKRLAAVKKPYDAFFAKYGSSQHKRAVKCVTEVGALVKKAEEVLPSVIERAAIREAAAKIDSGSEQHEWHLEQAIKRAESATDIRKHIDALLPGWTAFKTKYEKSSHPDVKPVMDKYGPIIAQGEALIPIVKVHEAMFVAIRQIDGKDEKEQRQEQRTWNLERAVEDATSAERIRKYLDPVGAAYVAFKSKFGTADHDKARATVAKYDALIAKAQKVLPEAEEYERIEKAAHEIPDNAYRALEQALSYGNSADDVKKWVAKLQPPYDKFKAAWGSSSRERAKKVIKKYGDMLAKAQAELPLITEYAVIWNLSDAMYKEVLVSDLERQLKGWMQVKGGWNMKTLNPRFEAFTRHWDRIKPLCQKCAHPKAKKMLEEVQEIYDAAKKKNEEVTFKDSESRLLYCAAAKSLIDFDLKVGIPPDVAAKGNTAKRPYWSKACNAIDRGRELEKSLPEFKAKYEKHALYGVVCGPSIKAAEACLEWYRAAHNDMKGLADEERIQRELDKVRNAKAALEKIFADQNGKDCLAAHQKLKEELAWWLEHRGKLNFADAVPVVAESQALIASTHDIQFVWLAAQAQPELARIHERRDGHKITAAIKDVAAKIADLEAHKASHPQAAAVVLANGHALLEKARADAPKIITDQANADFAQETKWIAGYRNMVEHELDSYNYEGIQSYWSLERQIKSYVDKWHADRPAAVKPLKDDVEKFIEKNKNRHYQLQRKKEEEEAEKRRREREEEERKQKELQKQRERKRTCARCSGAGRETCYSCHGSGLFSKGSSQKCTSCSPNGSGSNSCGNCYGRGTHTNMTDDEWDRSYLSRK